MNKSYAHILLLLLIALSLFCTACTTRPCNTLAAVDNTFYADPNPLSGQTTNTVPVAYFSKAWMAPGDQIWLEFPCIPGNSYNVTSTETVHIISNVSGDTHRYLTVSPASGKKIRLSLAGNTPTSYPSNEEVSIQFMIGSNVFFTFEVFIRPKNKIKVLRGDANGNGHVDMLDLAAIAEGMYQGFRGSVLKRGPVATLLPQRSNWVEPWGDGWKWGGLVNEKIDFAHADMNGDGYINLDDFEILKTELGPIDLDLFLKDGINNAEFIVKRDLSQPIICFPAIGGSSAHVEIPYTVYNGSNAIDSVLGIVHRRPLTENSCGRINGLKPELESGFFSVTQELLGHHELWRQDLMHLENLCLKDGDVTLAVVDIGMFFTDAARNLGADDKVMNCIVDIDDILNKITDGLCPVNQYDFDGMAFGIGKDGGVNITPASCSATQFLLSPGDRCPSDPSLTLVIRDNDTDYGREKGPIPAAPWESPDITISGPNGMVVDSVQAQGEYDIVVQVINLSCDTVTGDSVKLYWTEKGVNDNVTIGDLVPIGTMPIPQILPKSKADINFLNFDFNPLPTSSEVSFIAIIDHPLDPKPQVLSLGGSFQLGALVTNHNNVAALKMPVFP